MSYPRHPRTDPDAMTPAEHEDTFDRPFWAVFLAIAIIGTITWLAIVEHNYQPRTNQVTDVGDLIEPFYRYNEDVMILQEGDSELDFNHPSTGGVHHLVAAWEKECEGVAKVSYRIGPYACHRQKLLAHALA